MSYPKFHLLCFNEENLHDFLDMQKTHPLPSSFSISYHTGALKSLDPSVQFDTVVSPANSYGRMDGGFDDALSKVLSPRAEYLALTHVVQEQLYTEWRGFAPPGTCTLVPFDFAKQGKKTPLNVWGCRMVAVCPTMRQPQPIPWEIEIVYECMWSLLCAIQKWNGKCNDGEQRIESVLMTPLGTATGGIPSKQWAAQMLLALKHFDEAEKDKAKWSRLEVSQIQDLCEEVARTHKIS